MVFKSERIPVATSYRLSLYHCYLAEALLDNESLVLTSRDLAERLQLKEETVRRDISFVGGVGRPGAGYAGRALYDSIQEFLGLRENYPVIRVGTREVLRALELIFPPAAFGVTPVAYFSEDPEDVGLLFDGIPIQHVMNIPSAIADLGVSVAMVVCSRKWAQTVVDLCAVAGIKGILLVTPVLTLDTPEGVNITQIRMPCDIKSLACRCQKPSDAEVE